MKLRLGTRGSALAVTQSETVAEQLRALGHDVELVQIKTTGDRATGSLTRLSGLGVFAAELRQALLDGRCDFAVHSLKDLPVEPVPGLSIVAIPGRVDPRDALCSRGETLAQLPAGAKVGTGSPRRIAQLRALRPDLRYVDVRGNVGTRLARVAEGDLDAVILAVAGLTRLGRSDAITEILDLLPAPGQGALALECRSDRADLIAALSTIDDAQVRLAVEAERQVLQQLGGGCAAPIAAWAHSGRLAAGVFSLDGAKSVRAELELDSQAGQRAAAELLQRGAAEVTQLDASAPSKLANLHDDVSLWRGETVVAGVKVFYPRAEGALADALRAAGAEVEAVPVLSRTTLQPTSELGAPDWVALTSAAAVESLAELGITIPSGTKIAAVGQATAEALQEQGYHVDLVPQGKASAAALLESWPAGSGTVVIPASALAKDTLAEGLRAKGYAVTQLPIYTMSAVTDLPAATSTSFSAGYFDVVTVFSGSMGQAIDQLLGWPQQTRVVAFGEPTAIVLRELGVPVAAVAQTQDASGLVAAVAAAGRTNT